ncbi:MAG TPA: helix-turn-helix domain-containing protein [Bryobacteraceae bacterium]|nr:helix-turn-helix domain-containing protein [Bryobacteraceae bacterium]
MNTSRRTRRSYEITKDRPLLSAAVLSIRKRMDINQAQLGRILSIAQNTVSRWERGQIVPATWQLINLYQRARTEEEIRPILQILEARGVSLAAPDASGEPHQTASIPAPAEDLCSAGEGAS